MPEPFTISETAPRIAAGELRPTELLERCLARIERCEPACRAWVVIDAEQARRAAAELDAELASGECRGPLHGMPLGVKDIIDVAALPTRAGSPLSDPAPARADAPIVARLRAAGAVVLGKTVTCEWACFDPAETRNPWDPDRTPGGSSSGSAAAVALGMCPAALGTQTGGSITRPAAYCGVAGLKPTWNRLPLEGIVPVSGHLDHVGPLAATAADLALLWRALSGAAPRVGDVPTAPDASPPHPPRLGLLAGDFTDRAEPTVRAVVESALQKLAAAGAPVTAAELPASLADSIAMHRRIMAVDAAALHADRFAGDRDRFGPRITELLEEGLAIPADDYRAARSRQERARGEAAAAWREGPLHELDALVTPATPDIAPGRETTGDPRFNVPFSYTGLPTVAIPCGLADDRLPVGLQLIGPPGGETELLAVATWCERQLAFDRRLPS